MNTKKPLEGYKVVDFSAVFAGPLCSRYLLDCGAEVIKVETPGVGDLIRGVDGTSRVFGHFNAGKRSIAVNLKSAAGQMLVKRLISDADIVIENFRPGIMAKFGLDYESLKKENPEASLLLYFRLWPVRALREPRRLRPHRPCRQWF